MDIPNKDCYTMRDAKFLAKKRELNERTVWFLVICKAMQIDVDISGPIYGYHANQCAKGIIK